MEIIIKNLYDPSWWFTGLFFVIIAYLLPKVLRWITNIPIYKEGLIRKIQLKQTLRVKSIRFDNTKVIIEAIKTYTWMILFGLTVFIFMYSYLFTSSTVLYNKLILSFPIYIIEGIFLFQRNFLYRLLKSRDKLLKIK